MSQVIGKISSINGSFFIKSPDGELTSAKIGDTIYEGDILIGSASNSDSNLASVLLVDNSNNVVISGNQEQLFDTTLFPIQLAGDTSIGSEDLGQSLIDESISNIQEQPTLDNEQATLTAAQIENLDAAAAGAEADGTNTEVLLARLEDRTAGEVNISTDLRDSASTVTVVNEDPAIASTIILADEITPPDVIVPPAEITPIDAILTLNEVNAQEGTDVTTISGSLDQTPLSTLVVTLSNGSTLTFGTTYVPGTLVESTPFAIQGDDVYIDAESYPVSGTSYVGGGFNSIEGNTTTVSIADTIDTTTVTVTSADVNEDAESTTFNFQTSNAPQDGTSATLTVTLNGVEQTVALDASGKGSLVVDSNNPDVYNDSQSYEVVVTSINGGNFEATSVIGASATSTITDTINTTTATLTSTGDGDEDNGSITYTVTVASKPEDNQDFTISLSNGQTETITILGGETSGSITFAWGNLASEDTTTLIGYPDADVYKEDDFTLSVTNFDNVGNAGNYELLNVSDNSTDITIEDTINTAVLTVNESQNSDGTYTYTAVVTNTPDAENNLMITLDNGQIITITNTQTTASITSETQASGVASVSGGNYEDLDGIYGFGQNIIMSISANNSLDNIDLNTSYFDSDDISTQLPINSIILNPRVDSEGYAINANEDRLTSTDNIGTEQETKYYIKYDNTDPNNISAYRVETSGTQHPSEVVFTISSSTSNENYSVSLGTYSLDGAGYTNTITFDSSTSATGGTGGNQPALLFNVSGLYVVATAQGDSNVNYNASGDLGVNQSNDVNSSETLVLNFANSNITSKFNSNGDSYDLNNDNSFTSTEDLKNNNYNASDIESIRTDMEDLNYAQALSNAKFTLFIDSNLKNDAEIVKWEAYNHGVLVGTNNISFDSSDLFNIGNSQNVYGSLDVSSSMDKGSIVINQNDINNGWEVTNTTITYNGADLSDTISFDYSINGVEYTASNFSLNQGESIDLDNFNEVSFTGVNTQSNSTEFSLYSMEAISSEDIPAENQVINIDIETSNGAESASGIMQITFDGDDVIVGTAEDEVIDYTGITSIDGGDGTDTLVLTNGAIDFESIPDNEIQSVENIDLTDSDSQSITHISLSDVMDLVPEPSNIIGTNVLASDHVLRITGDDSDSVSLSNAGATWSSSGVETIDNVSYDLYINDTDNTYKILIQTDIEDTIA